MRCLSCGMGIGELSSLCMLKSVRQRISWDLDESVYRRSSLGGTAIDLSDLDICEMSRAKYILP